MTGGPDWLAGPGDGVTGGPDWLADSGDVPPPAFGGVFEAAVDRVLGRPPGQPALPHMLLFAGANLGFTDQQAAAVLADHRSLVYLGRLWDARRVDGQPLGGDRLPARIRRLAGQDDVTGRLHRRLLERTGLALPADLAAECELHLALWQVAQPVYRAMGAQSQVGPEAVAQSPAGLLAVAVRPHGPGLAVEITGAPAGRYRVTLHWADAEPGAQDAVPAKAAPGQDPAPTTPQPPAPVATGVVAVGPDGAGTLELTPPASGLPASIKVARLGGQHPQEEESA